MVWSCGECKLPTNVIRMDLNCTLCLQCANSRRQSKAKLIRKLPTISASKAPLGYHYFQNNYFSDSSKGENYASGIFVNYRSWVVN